MDSINRGIDKKMSFIGGKYAQWKSSLDFCSQLIAIAKVDRVKGAFVNSLE